jgi:hypothetical protein
LPVRFSGARSDLKDLQLTKDDFAACIPLIFPNWEEECEAHIPKIVFRRRCPTFGFWMDYEEAAEFLSFFYRYTVVERDKPRARPCQSLPS